MTGRQTKDCACMLPLMHLPLQLAGPLLRCISLLPELNVEKVLGFNELIKKCFETD